MQYVLLLFALSSSYFVEWIPNNATTTTTTTASSPGEFPWQL